MLHLPNTENDVFHLLENRTNMCRFCFDILDPTTSHYSIFADETLRILNYCCKDLSIKNDEILPSLICSGCHSFLQIAYKFLNQVTLSQNILFNYIQARGFQNVEIQNNQEEIKLLDGNLLETDSNYFEKTEIFDNIEQPTEEIEVKEVLVKKKNAKVKGRKSMGPYNCAVCNKKYKSNYELEVHLRSHTGERPFTCSVCGKTFLDGRNLRKHEKIHSGDKNHECSICHKKFLHLFSLKTHERIHTGEKKFVCEICGKAFNTSGELRIHSRIHTNERPYICNICEKRFSSKAALNIHTRIHTGEKRHCCSICDQKCRTGYDLKVHMRSHSNEKPYHCKYANCDKSYRNSSQLSVHLRTHTGEKHHQCMVCYKRFGESNALKRHLLTHEKNA